MKLDFIKEHKSFDIYCRTHVLSVNAQLFWYRLFMLANNAFYPDELFLPNCQAMCMTGTDDPRKLCKAREELIKAGLLIYTPGKKSSPGRYVLCSVAEAMCAGAQSSPSDCDHDGKNGAGTESENVYGYDTEYAYENAGEYADENAGEYAGENRAELYKEYYNNIKQNKNKKQNNTHTKTKSGARVDDSFFSAFETDKTADNCRDKDTVGCPVKRTGGDSAGIKRVGADRLFESFWELYPKKKGREKAKEAFLSADIDIETFGSIKAALLRAKDTVAWNIECGRYVPSAERYIRERRWNDVITDGELKNDSDTFGDADEFLAAAIRKGLDTMRN